MGRGHAWLDTGTHESLLDAGQFIATIENARVKNRLFGRNCFLNKWINAEQLETLAQPLIKNPYGQYLLGLLKKV